MVLRIKSISKSVIFCLLCTLAVSAQAAATLRVTSQGGGFPLVADGRAAAISVSPKEPLVVGKVARLLADDIQRVTGLRPAVSAKSNDKASVVVATIGHNAEVDKLIAKGRLDVSAIRGGWEQFVIRELDNRLYIVGSDRRGTAYGVFALSEQMGVSPWYWWADVPVKQRNALYVTADYTSTAPTIKYRGIFINDEDWGLLPWAAKNYEKELGDIGPRTYARVCELLLRLKANMLAPAMHSCTGAFYSHLESAAVADSFGIIITTSHCEPLLLNNAAESEWNQERDGDWNYKTNSKTIYRKWDNRLKDAARYENIYTVAMRGVHDAGLRGNLPMTERVPLIEQVISDQRALLKKHHAYTPPYSPSKLEGEAGGWGSRRGAGGETPQIFVPYKETMDIYENGLRVPDDITLVWVDDNYGYLKRVSTPAEQQRCGRAGVYYHLSYLGAPHDYLWLNTTPPVLMYEELKKAYDHGADRYWLLNVGDIKPMELGIQTFMDMAWNLSAFDMENVNRHQAAFLASLFGNDNCQLSIVNYQFILDDYYRLAWIRKPEYMGFEYEWDDAAHTGLKPTDFSFKEGDEAQQRLAEYQRISDEVERVNEELRMKNEELATAFFQLLQFPVQAAYQMNRKFLMAQLNKELVAEGRLAEANWAARQMELAYDSIRALNRRYNQLLGGKWDGMMTVPPGYCALYHQKPVVIYTLGAGEQPVLLTPLRGNRRQDCYTIDLAHTLSTTPGTTVIGGLGYDGRVVQLGKPSAAAATETATYPFVASNCDAVDVVLYTVPFWPLYAGKSNRVGVSIDGSPVQVFENKFHEYSRSWKDQVMRNAAVCRLHFALDASKTRHTLTLHGIDPGQMVQRVVIINEK